ncbi:hypothetical protein PENSPDRAFT_420399 [Peniophora sp. CONT]|nr:hypothetical protein PENSPDRAFT_420399 [Peniophora sp. CONT]
MVYFPLLEGQESHILPGTSDLRRLMLYIWYHHPDQETRAWFCSGDSLLVYTCRSLQCAKGSLQTFEAFIEDDIIAEYKPAEFLKHISRTLRNPQLIDEELYVVAAYIGHAIMSPAFHPHFVASGAFSAIREAIDRQRTRGLQDGDSQWRTFEELLTVLRAVSADAPFDKGIGAMLQPPCNVIELIARAFIYATRTTRPSWVTTLEILNVYRPAAVRLRDQKGDTKASAAFKVLKKALQREWYKTLRPFENGSPHSLSKGSVGKHSLSPRGLTLAWSWVLTRRRRKETVSAR